jgi:hypothetical protein
MSTKLPGRVGRFLRYHSLGFATAGVLVLWVLLYSRSSPTTHADSFFGNAIAEWSGVLVTIVATKYFYEVGSVESRQPHGKPRSRLQQLLRDHSLTIFLALTGIGWVVL